MTRSRSPNSNASTGQRDRRVTLYSLHASPDSGGGVTLTDQAELSAWARVRRLWGNETVIAGALSGRQSVEVFLPASSAARDISTAWVLVDSHTGKRFNIREVSLSEDRAEVRLLCESGVPL